MKSIPWLHRALLAGLAAGALVPSPAPAQGPAQSREDAAPGLSRWSAPTTPAHLAIAKVLRESRRSSAAPPAKLVERLTKAGPEAPQALVDVLARARVPETAPDDAPQILSEAQRDLVVLALAKSPAEAVRNAVRAELQAQVPGPGAPLAAVRALGAIGGAGDLLQVAELAPRQGRGQPLLPEARTALRDACASVLSRDPRGYAALADLVRRSDAEVGRALLESLGSRRNPRALPVLLAAARAKSELGPQAAARAAACGGSTDPTLDRDFCAWALAALPSARPEFARSLLQALGSVDDGTLVPEMIARLADADAGVRDSALWALRKTSRLGLPADATSWTTWFHAEADWHEKARPALKADLESGDLAKAALALRAYAEHRTRRSELASDVARALGNSTPELRRLSCEILGQLGSPSACSALVERLTDEDEGVREAAYQALREVTGLDLPREPTSLREVLRVL